MADNTAIATDLGAIRTLDKTGTGSPKTEVVALDFGGGDGRGENILSFPVPTAPDLPPDDDGFPTLSLSPSTLDAIEALFRQLMLVDSGPTLTPVAPSSVSVGVASVSVVAANPFRKGLVLTNTSTAGQTISLGLNNGVPVVLSGIVLWPGDVWEMDRYSIVLGSINAIASAASGSLAVQEFS